ncbi:hypothetical protein GCM10025858_22610 [Alicyclobacillus sacchari]|nr:hypothetical protein GCM10025858_22610 [Alicyclobacillus sacchari]
MGTRLIGIAASDGVAIAPAFVLSASVKVVEERRGVEIASEIERLEVAIGAAKADLESLRETADAKLGAEHAQIFTAHIQILEDPEFAGAIRGVIEGEQVNAEFALDQVAKQLIALFEQMDNEYMRQRAADIKDVSQRLLARLQGGSQSSLADIRERSCWSPTIWLHRTPFSWMRRWCAHLSPILAGARRIPRLWRDRLAFLLWWDLARLRPTCRPGR